MKYLSICSGIEAASVAWHPLGWTPIGFSEIEPFPSAVLAHHYPTITNYGDMTKYEQWNIKSGTVDLLVGGTPCQSFSVAGLRQGLKDPRGNLMLTFLAIAERIKPKWIVWENVPGVLSSNGGKDFGSFLGGLGELGYGFAYRVLDAQWVRTQRHPRAVPQRRRRVFVVACAGDHISPAKVLFESESMLRYSAKSKATRQGIAEDVAGCIRSGGDGGVPSSRGEHLTFSAPISSTLNASFADKQGLEDQHALNGAPCFVIDVPIKQPCWWDGGNTASTLTKSNANGAQRMPDKDNFGAVLQPYNIVFNDANGKRKDRINGGLYINKTDVSTSLTQAESDTKILTTVAALQPVPFVKAKRAQSTTDNETWVEGVVAPTQNAFDVGDVRATTAILFENHPNDSRVTGPHDVAPSCVAIQGTVIGRQDHNGPQGSGCSDDGEMFTLNSTDVHAVAVVGQVDWRTANNDQGQVSQTLKTDLAHQSGPCLAVTYSFDSLASNSMKSSNPISGCNMVDVAKCIDTSNPCPSKNQGGIAVAVAPTMQVRRLTPTECERLQGFPDGWTAIPWKKKDAEDCPDGPRYKALGNSMAVNCMEWIGERIATVNATMDRP